MKKLIENVRLDSCISNNPTYDELYEQLRLAEKRLAKQNEVCPCCGNRWYFDTEIASNNLRYYATYETCCLNFFFDENEFTDKII